LGIVKKSYRVYLMRDDGTIGKPERSPPCARGVNENAR